MDHEEFDVELWDIEEETSSRPSLIAWLILLLLVCALLLPLVSPIIQSYQYDFRPQPTPTPFPPNLVRYEPSFINDNSKLNDKGYSYDHNL